VLSKDLVEIVFHGRGVKHFHSLEQKDVVHHYELLQEYLEMKYILEVKYTIPT